MMIDREVTMDKLKVIFHTDNYGSWIKVLANLRNLLNEKSSDKIQIEVLANGNSVKGYVKDQLDQELGQKMQDLSKEGLVFAACNNSLKGLEIEKEDLFDFVRVVSAGVLELTEKQNEGYAYIKP